ncbi:MAG: enoyl-CoA hydratase/isomerase family protein [bacterium]
MDMKSGNVKTSINDGVAIIRISRPGVRNALDSRTIEELHHTMEGLNGDEKVRVVILTGEGSSFVAGADLRELKDFDSQSARKYVVLGQKMLSYVEEMDKPVIAAINGHCLGGGCEIALACDLRVCSAEAKIGQPGLGLGVIPVFAGTRRLTRLIGIGRAKEMVYTGEPLSAGRALEMGLVNWVVQPDQVLSFTMKLAGKLKSKAPIALRTVKKLINAENMELMSTSGDLEIDAFGEIFSTDGPRKGIQAFLRKEKPTW